MNTESFFTFLRELMPSLERFLIGLIGYLGGIASEKNKIVLKASEARLKALEQKQEIQTRLKELSKEELAKNAVED